MLDVIQTILDVIANSKIVEFIQSVLENFGLSSSAVEPESVPLATLVPAEPVVPDAPRVDALGNEEIPGAAATW